MEQDDDEAEAERASTSKVSLACCSSIYALRRDESNEKIPPTSLSFQFLRNFPCPQVPKKRAAAARDQDDDEEEEEDEEEQVKPRKRASLGGKKKVIDSEEDESEGTHPFLRL